jgi:hypothetical protein
MIEIQIIIFYNLILTNIKTKTYLLLFFFHFDILMIF